MRKVVELDVDVRYVAAFQAPEQNDLWFRRSLQISVRAERCISQQYRLDRGKAWTNERQPQHQLREDVWRRLSHEAIEEVASTILQFDDASARPKIHNHALVQDEYRVDLLDVGHTVVAHPLFNVLLRDAKVSSVFVGEGKEGTT